MKILVINGSPKGDQSITLQTVNFLKIKFPEHDFSVLNAAQRIKKLKKNFTEAADAIKNAELLLFSYPVYTFIAPCQLHEFIGLLKDAGLDLSQKYASQITTSKHFYDVTAHRYVKDNCSDLGIRYIDGLSADMEDITTKKGREQAEAFLSHLVWSIENGIYHKPEPAGHTELFSATVPEPTEKGEGDIVIVADLARDDVRLKSMIDRFVAVMPIKVRVINIAEYPFSGGCLGCFDCAATGKCIYKDGFDDFLRNRIQTAQATVYAFSVKDHSMGVNLKTYDDRQFCNGHRTVTMGAPVGYLVNGDLTREENLRMIINGRASVGGNYLAGVATNETQPDEAIDKLALELEYAVKNKYLQPSDFYGVGGMKIFRDLIWQMQGLMRADHKFFKKHGQYDFPQKQRGKMLAMYAVGALMNNKKLKRKMGGRITEGMLMPYNKMLDDVKKENNKNA